jgi:hypothetical protein
VLPLPRIIVAALIAFVAPACAGGDVAGSDVDEPECELSTDCPDRGLCVDGVCEACDFGLPPPNDVCLPVCGTVLGVGQPCTPGGGECAQWLPDGAFFCTVDFVPDADLQMCTRPCGEDVDCGADAVCIGDPKDPDSDKGCVPASCGE